MKKILALARRGVGGEKATAEAMLAKLLARYGMTVADLDGDEQKAERHFFTYRTDTERRLLIQIVANITGANSIHHWKRKGKRVIGFELTTLQYAEVDVRYEAYRGPLQAELNKTTNRVYAAFVQANDLGVSRTNEDDDSDRPPTDLDELMAVMALMQTMRPVPIHRQIEREAAA
jgi:hypothetical protein